MSTSMRMRLRLRRTRVGWAEEDGAGPSVVVVESDSAGPSATVTEVRNMVVLESKSERSRRLLSQRIGGEAWCACVFLVFYYDSYDQISKL